MANYLSIRPQAHCNTCDSFNFFSYRFSLNCNFRFNVCIKTNKTLSMRKDSRVNPFSRIQLFKKNFCPVFCAMEHMDAAAEVDMVKSKDGIWSAKPKRVVVLWDLDNKPPKGRPYPAAMALREVAEKFGDVIGFSAYANRHAFIHLPQWVIDERRERRRLDILERKGVSISEQPYICSVCGRKCRTNLDLKKHFKQLHERERQKKLNRMRSLKGKKRQRYKERFITGNQKYEEAARELITPKAGYGLASELRKAGVFVKMVEDKPQAADWALKRQMQHSMSQGVDWLFLVSDDSDFSDMLRRAREFGLRTVVIGDGQRALGKQADIWVPWTGVENGEIGDEDLFSSKLRDGFVEEEDGLFSLAESDDESDLNEFVDELVVTNSSFNVTRISAFSEEEGLRKKDKEGSERKGHFGLLQNVFGEALFLESDEEDSDSEDGYY